MNLRTEIRRAPWLDPDPKPRDLDKASRALFHGENPNQPHPSASLRSSHLLRTPASHQRSMTAPLDRSGKQRKTGRRNRSASVCDNDRVFLLQVTHMKTSWKHHLQSSNLRWHLGMTLPSKCILIFILKDTRPSTGHFQPLVELWITVKSSSAVFAIQLLFFIQTFLYRLNFKLMPNLTF